MTDRDLFCARGVHFVVVYGEGEAKDALRRRVTAALTAAGCSPTRVVTTSKPELRVVKGDAS